MSSGRPDIRRWERGPAGFLPKANNQLEAIENELVSLASGPAQVRRGPGRVVIRLRFKSQQNDYIVCRTWDGTNEGSEDVNVAKPEQVRGVTGGVVPPYIADDEIYAVRVAGTGVEVSSVQLSLVDANIDARAFHAGLGKLTASSGDAGDEDNDCTFTYTLADLAGNQLATGLSPKRPRFPKTTYDAAPADSYATYTHDGTSFILLDAIEEWPQSDNCEEA